MSGDFTARLRDEMVKDDVWVESTNLARVAGKLGAVFMPEACEPELMYREAAIVTTPAELHDLFNGPHAVVERFIRHGAAPFRAGESAPPIDPERAAAASLQRIANLRAEGDSHTESDGAEPATPNTREGGG